jgi:YegS/Rv2252/BmrU family lipid kinase
MREATIICRLSSRHGIEYYKRLQDELPKHGFAIVEAHMVRRRRELKKRVRQAVEADRKLVIVVGGDGTQTAAVAELAHSDTVMAVVPAGTGNSFALSLGIHNDIDEVIETIVSGKEIRVDLGVVNGTYFANVASVGLIAEAANVTPNPLKRIFGSLAYGFAALVPLFRDKPFELHVKWHGNDLKLRTRQAILASGRYFGWQPLTPDASIRSGELAFFATEMDTPPEAIVTNVALLAGRQTKLKDAHYFSASTITVKTKPKQPLNVDGHALGTTPAKFSVAPRALRVLVPQNFEDEA